MPFGTRVAVALGLACLLGGPVDAQTPLGTTFSYQGRLTDTGSPALRTARPSPGGVPQGLLNHEDHEVHKG